MKKAGKRGFSLVELLVLIAVVAILSGIVVTALGNVRMQAEKSGCVSNMRQLGMALLMHANQNGGMLPGTAHEMRQNSWILSLAEFLEDVDAVRISPADPLAEQRLQATTGTSYVANDLVFSLGERYDHRGRLLPNEPGQGSLVTLEHPEETFLLFVGSERRGDDISNDHTHATFWGGNWRAFTNDVMPDIFRTGERDRHRTRGSSNYLYADGRVETIEASKVHDWITSGVNIAEPPERR